MSIRLLSFVVTLCAASVSAQTTPCFAQNDTTNTVSGAITAFSFAGPGVRAYQFTPTVPVVTGGGRIYTGNTLSAGFMTLEIWSNDTTTSLPNQRLTGGTWRISAALANAWQGANFDQTAVLLPNVAYWAIWIDPGSSTIPTDPTGTPAPAFLRSGTTWNSAPAAALKLRLYCSLLDAQGVAVQGSSCANSTSATGNASTNQPATVGNANFAVEASGFPANAAGVFVLGVVPNWVSVPLPGGPTGCSVNTAPLLTLAVMTGTGNQRAATFLGHTDFALPLPGDPSAVGFFFSASFAVLDTNASAPLPIVTTNALRITLF